MKDMRRYLPLILLLIFEGSVAGQKDIVRWSEYSLSDIDCDKEFVLDIRDGILSVTVQGSGEKDFTIHIPEGSQDLSKSARINLEIANTGNSQCRISVRLNDKKWVAGALVLKPGETDYLEILFLHEVDRNNAFFPNMDGIPGGNLYIWDPVDPSLVKALNVELVSDKPAQIEFGRIVAEGVHYTPAEIAAKQGFFPFIDEYGQYSHGEWPGKVHSDSDLVVNRDFELRELAIIPGPKSFDKYGGWEDGPKLKATGSFYVEKVNGSWWLIDPEGKLFWSHGVNCVGFGSGNTQVGGREKYFTGIPEGSTRFNFYTANLGRKYGDDWQKYSIGHIHRRLRSWGMNTIANWSDALVYFSESPRTPYTANISYRSPALDGAAFKFPDVFDPQFRQSLETGINRTLERTFNDSWCIGYFIDNELYLGNYDDFANVVMKQKPAGAAKKALAEFLKGRYTVIRELNRLYKTRYRSWDELMNAVELPSAAGKDIADFNSIIIETYYSTCSELMKKLAPGKLYLGNRFNLYRIYYPDVTLINSVIATAAKFCDIVSINYYRFNCDDLVLPYSIDRPVIIGEFHFGALDRGLPHTGLRNVRTQEQRSDIYKYYVDQALVNPQIVGTHWFQYGDQPFTGRSDGENYQIGFVDVCDTPYPETIRALRDIGYNMYRTRFKDPEKK
ncbi:MAG: hypothetical protein MUE74_05320 [Bacteroidales bacterium]|nr:hypothetical protein [Bacteroidales bacterium]